MYKDCHYYERHAENFEDCPVRLHASDALTRDCVGCPYNVFDIESTLKLIASEQGVEADVCKCGAPGSRRYDNCLDSGVHCDKCWDKMIAVCRSRSW